jgi:hypothetical protein
MPKKKDLYTYVEDICNISMQEARYKGLMIVVSRAAMRELMKHGLTLLDAVEVLERGHDAPRKRKKGTVEKWLDKGNKTWNAVVARDYNESMKEDCWVLIHFGRFAGK